MLFYVSYDAYSIPAKFVLRYRENVNSVDRVQTAPKFRIIAYIFSTVYNRSGAFPVICDPG